MKNLFVALTVLLTVTSASAFFDNANFNPWDNDNNNRWITTIVGHLTTLMVMLTTTESLHTIVTTTGIHVGTQLSLLIW